jgi:hypothetical protein
VAGHRRRRPESGERPGLPDLPEPEKPLTEMTAAERNTYTARLGRALRDDEVRRGRRPPRSMREVEIWREGRTVHDEQAAARLARAEPRESGG